MFRVGQKVICISDTNFDCNGEETPKKGVVYTVRDIYPEGDAIRLNEIRNNKRLYKDGSRIVFEEAFWGCNHFAPIQEYGDSMSISMQLIQELERVDKPQLPVKEPKKQEA